VPRYEFFGPAQKLFCVRGTQLIPVAAREQGAAIGGDTPRSQVRMRLAGGGRWIRTSGSRARSESARRCPKDFGSSPSTVRTSAACNRISGPAPDCRSADTGIRRSGCRRPPRCSGYAYHLTARQAAAYEQTVRFSYLVRSPNEEEFAKYERAIVAKMNSLVRTVNAETRKHYEELRVRCRPGSPRHRPRSNEHILMRGARLTSNRWRRNAMRFLLFRTAF
jgi:hypothetical protein